MKDIGTLFYRAGYGKIVIKRIEVVLNICWEYSLPFNGTIKILESSRQEKGQIYGLNQNDINKILSLDSCQHFTVKKGEIIEHSNRESDSIFFLKTGIISLSIPGGEKLKIEHIKGGYFFGVISLLTGRTMLTVEVVEESEVIQIDISDVLKLCSQDGIFSMKFYKYVAIFIANIARQITKGLSMSKKGSEKKKKIKSFSLRDDFYLNWEVDGVKDIISVFDENFNYKDPFTKDKNIDELEELKIHLTGLFHKFSPWKWTINNEFETQNNEEEGKTTFFQQCTVSIKSESCQIVEDTFNYFTKNEDGKLCKCELYFDKSDLISSKKKKIYTLSAKWKE